MTQACSRRVLLYGDVNLNIIDGSSIWLSSIASALSLTGAQVDVLLKAPIIEDRISRQIAETPGVTLIDEHQGEGGRSSEYSPRTAAQRIVELDQLVRYDLIITRGMAIAYALARSGRLSGRLWPYLTDIPQTASCMTADQVEKLTRVAHNARRVFLQTEETRSFLEFHVQAAAGKTVLLPPMIPATVRRSTGVHVGPTPLRLVYAGKFAKRWRTLEMCELPAQLAARGIQCEVTMIGEKFQNDPEDPLWVKKMQAAIHAPGVTWLGGMTRDDALAQLGDHHVGLAWRDPSMDSSHEISTKLLEYIASGLPPIVNLTAAHEELLGHDYPLFTANDDIVDLLVEISRDPALLERARSLCRGAVDSFRVPSVAANLSREFERAIPSSALPSWDQSTVSVLLAGHDLKFAGELIDWLSSNPKLNLHIDAWESLYKHDPERSSKLLDASDVIICEWAGPNSVWYSREKRARQRLIVRLHMFELNAPWISDLNVEAVDALVCVSDYYADLAVKKLGIDPERVVVLPNTVDSLDLARPKFEGSAFHLGLVGVVPLRKRLDRALDLMERLVRCDPRFTLHIRGRLPEEYPWEWRKPIVQSYYREQYRRALFDEPLQGHVALDYFGADMGSWLRRIGWVLSPSTDESFHLAPMEGMSSGAIPLIWPRPGAEAIFGPEWIFEDLDRIVEFVIETVQDPNLLRIRSHEAVKSAQAYDVPVVMERWDSLIGVKRPE